MQTPKLRSQQSHQWREPQTPEHLRVTLSTVNGNAREKRQQ